MQSAATDRDASAAGTDAVPSFSATDFSAHSPPLEVPSRGSRTTTQRSRAASRAASKSGGGGPMDSIFCRETDTTRNIAWTIARLFHSSHPHPEVKHHIDSWNDLISEQLPKLFQQYNPIKVYHGFNEDMNKYNTEVRLYFSNVRYSRAIIHENNGSTKPMYPVDARLRNLTYSSSLYIDIRIEVTTFSGDALQLIERQERKILNVNIGGKLPIMIMSSLCQLSERSKPSFRDLGECPYESGGYFIINGSEKVIISQERQAHNIAYCFRNTKSTKYSHVVEVKSVSAEQLLPAKTLSVKITMKDGLMGKQIYVGCTHFRQDIPLFVLFRALGIESDRDIAEHIVFDVDDPTNAPLLQLIQPSMEECNTIMTQHKALEYLSKYVHILGHPKEVKLDNDKRISYVMDALHKDMLPHLGNKLFRKAFYLGYMVRRLLMFYLGYTKADDRDSYANKRVDTSGALMANLIRQYITKSIKDIRNALMKEMNTGSWKYSRNIDDLINHTNIYKIVKSTTIESGLKYALATGNWGMKTTVSKVGVAQVLNRLSHNGTLSHMRRVNTPVEKTSKLILPRKLHATSWGYTCPAETPEGGSIGVVKNLAFTCEITLDISPSTAERAVLEHEATRAFDETVLPRDLCGDAFVVLVNGVFTALTRDPIVLATALREMRRRGVLHPHTSIALNIGQRQIQVQTDAGRVTRPLLILDRRVGEDGRITLRTRLGGETLRRLRNQSNITWNDLVLGYEGDDGAYHPPVVEYLDAQETACSLVATDWRAYYSGGVGAAAAPKKSVSIDAASKHYTHCEIHPSLILGAIASTICFPDHNQSPRNTYQSCMAKQAIGVCTQNFTERMDTLTNVLSYSSRPLIMTQQARMTKQDKMPSGTLCYVAILSYTGFNQEDSVIINQAALSRGMCHSTFYRTYKDEEKKNQSSGEEEKFMRPSLDRTRGMKPGSYAALDASGFARRNKFLSGGDVVIGKVIPVRDHAKGVNQNKPYRDQSTTLRHNESGYVDCLYESRNGDGYRFVKVRTRLQREPDIGDKFSSCHGQKGTVGMVLGQEDMPFTKDGLVPDILVNPHCIPSRMTIAQLFECIYGKACLARGRHGDGTAFSDLTHEDIADVLRAEGMEEYGNEVLYNGQTGDMLPCKIFCGPVYMQRLKHMAQDKIHSRRTGPKVMLTRQPAEGRSRDGGLRIGEMERDCLIAHGAASLINDSFLKRSDIYKMYVDCKDGMQVAVNEEKGIYRTFNRDAASFSELVSPYSMKLFLQELQAMAIAPRLLTPYSERRDGDIGRAPAHERA